MRTNRILVSALLFLISSPSFSKVFDAQIKMVNFPQEQEAKVHKAIELIKKVVLSPDWFRCESSITTKVGNVSWQVLQRDNQ